MTRGPRALGSILLVAAALGCDPGTSAVTVRTDPGSLVDDLERVEVSLVASCDAQDTSGEAPRGAIATVEAVRGDGATMAFGDVDRGPAGLYARAWDARCQVVAAGCADVVVGDGDLEVTLRTVAGPGCAAGERCVATRCELGGMDAGPPIDAGPADGGPPGDAGTAPDAGDGDGGPPQLACRPTSPSPREDPLVLYTFQSPDSASLVEDRAPAAPDVPLTGVAPIRVEGGAVILEGGHLIADQPASEALQEALLTAQALTVEVWFSVADLVLEEAVGPERLVTLSENAGARAFTIGVETGQTVMRLRSSTTDGNGTACLAPDAGVRPPLITPPYQAVGTVNHAVMTFDAAGGPRAYLDGAATTWDYCPGAPTLDWTAGVNRLVLGEEVLGGRTFEGTVLRVAIYARAMDGAEVDCWFRRGADAPLYE